MKMKTTLTCLTLVSAAALAGCSGSPNVSYGSISRNLTPELRGSTERPVDVDRNMAVVKNMSWRLLSDDLGRVFYTNSPSSLAPLPIVATSGMPR
jgi:hypothetical protein